MLCNGTDKIVLVIHRLRQGTDTENGRSAKSSFLGT